MLKLMEGRSVWGLSDDVDEVDDEDGGGGVTVQQDGINKLDLCEQMTSTYRLNLCWVQVLKVEFVCLSSVF